MVHRCTYITSGPRLGQYLKYVTTYSECELLIASLISLIHRNTAVHFFSDCFPSLALDATKCRGDVLVSLNPCWHEMMWVYLFILSLSQHIQRLCWMFSSRQLRWSEHRTPFLICSYHGSLWRLHIRALTGRWWPLGSPSLWPEPQPRWCTAATPPHVSHPELSGRTSCCRWRSQRPSGDPDPAASWLRPIKVNEIVNFEMHVVS